MNVPHAAAAVALISGFTFSSVPANGADFYVSTNGSPQGTGSISAPWDFRTVLAHPPAVRPGDTIHLRGGTYRTSGGVYFVSRLTGAANQHITVKSYAGEQAVIDGGIQIASPWVIFRDLEVFCSDPRRVSTQNSTWPTDVNQYASFGLYAPNVKLINNILHDNASGISGWIQAYDNEYYGNIIFYNGWQYGLYGAHGHGLYVQNRDGVKKIQDNVVFDQFDHGIHAYGSSNAALDNIEMDGNISFGNGMLGLYYSRNILIGGGVIARNPTVTNNYTYFPPRSTLGGENALGYGQGCTNLRLNGNYWVSGGFALSLNNCSIASMSGNTIYGQLSGISASSLLSLANQYLPLATPPTGTRVFVRPNRYEPGRAHVAIFNWARLSAVSADVSGIGLGIGESYEIRDVQNILGSPIATGVYNGTPILIPMTGTAVTRPVGNVPYQPTHTESEFGAFMIRRSGGTVSAPVDTTPPQVTVTSPTNGQAVSGAITLTASASDASGVQNVQFYLDGAPFGSQLPSSPYSTSLNTTTLANRSYSVTAVARDNAGNSATSPIVTMTVNNPVLTEAIRTDGAPTGTFAYGTTQTAMSLKTDKTATCRYSTAAGTSYSAMSSQFSATNGTSHVTTLSGLTGGSSYRFYVRCLTSQGIANTTDFQIAFSIASATQTGTSQPPSGSGYSQYIEAESGTLTNPMYILAWSQASGGYYVRSNTTDKGTVTLTFSVPASGNYTFWGRIFSANANNDSLWVSVDGGPEDLWDTAQGLWKSAWQWTRVTGRNANGGVPSPSNQNPRVFNLSAGPHTIRFRGAETYTYLDRVVVTNSSTFIPQ